MYRESNTDAAMLSLIPTAICDGQIIGGMASLMNHALIVEYEELLICVIIDEASELMFAHIFQCNFVPLASNWKHLVLPAATLVRTCKTVFGRQGSVGDGVLLEMSSLVVMVKHALCLITLLINLDPQTLSRNKSDSNPLIS